MRKRNNSDDKHQISPKQSAGVQSSGKQLPDAQGSDKEGYDAITTDGVAFRPRARILQLLGDQLIGTSRLAVFELVKNAYDADAKKVIVTLEGLDSGDTCIIVEDNGDGMSEDIINNIWLVPAHDHRENQRKSLKRTRLNRLPLGEKGLGRFAVHKLGDRIELVTRASKQKECVVIIDWSELIEQQFLSDAKVKVKTREPEVFKGAKTGTRITITKLRESNWSRGEVRRLLRQITSISSPFSKRSDVFKTELVVPDHPEWVSGIPDVEVLLKRAPWEFGFEFKDGLISWEYKFKGVPGLKLEPRVVNKRYEKLKINEERDIDSFGVDQSKKDKSSKPKKVVADSSITAGIGPVSGRFYVFDRESEVLNRLGDRSLVQSVLNENGGVRVYRDGIRVYNYGEPGDDWLGLDLGRVNAPGKNISRNIIIGAVDLKLDESTLLAEKTNREGFVENSAYRRLRQIVLGVLSDLATERKIDKDKIRVLTGKGQDVELTNIMQPLQSLRKAAKKHNVSKVFDPLIDKAEKNYIEMRETMLRAGISGIGLAIVFHEIEHGVRLLHNSIESGRKPELVQFQAKELVRVLDGFSELLRKGDRNNYSLKSLLKKARDINRVRFRSHQVKLICPALEDDFADVTSNFNFGLLLGALNNILDNAFYWLRVRWSDETDSFERTIYLNIDNDFADGPAIIIADNGPGLQDDPEKLRSPFFSRRPDGMGIGLYYTNMAMEINNGRLIFPANDEIELPDGIDGAVLALVFEKGD